MRLCVCIHERVDAYTVADSCESGLVWNVKWSGCRTKWKRFGLWPLVKWTVEVFPCARASYSSLLRRLIILQPLICLKVQSVFIHHWVCKSKPLSRVWTKLTFPLLWPRVCYAVPRKWTSLCSCLTCCFFLTTATKCLLMVGIVWSLWILQRVQSTVDLLHMEGGMR